MPTHAYLRVSTEQQDEASQRARIEAIAQAEGFTVASWNTDHASGKIPWLDRSLPLVLDLCEPGDTIIVSEISRIARSTVGILSFLETAQQQGVSLRSLQPPIIFKDDLMGQVAATLFSLIAQIERQFTSDRTRAALAAKKAAGIKLGRPEGSHGASLLDGKERQVADLLAKKVSKRAIARILDVSPGVLYRFLARKPDSDPNSLPLDLQPKPD